MSQIMTCLILNICTYKKKEKCIQGENLVKKTLPS